MIITTTMHIENKPVQEYKGIVFGEVVEGRNFVKDFMSGIRDIVGGRSGSYEDSLMNARKAALDEMSQRASKMECQCYYRCILPIQHSRCTKWYAYDYMQWYSRCSLINNRLSQI